MMSIRSEAELRQAMARDEESEHLEFKAATSGFSFEELVKYCVALSNEGGGCMVLGVSDKPPRRIVGSRAFPEIERTKAGLFDRLRWRIDATEFQTTGGRVLVFYAPGRPTGRPLEYRGTYWMRAGDTLVPMSHDRLRSIMAETTPDYSAELISGADLSALDGASIAEFRSRWRRKSNNREIDGWSDGALLENAELIIDGQVTVAALVLLGTRQALGRHLAQAELIFEYRSRPGAIGYQQRLEYRQGFLSWFDDLWTKVNLRNEVQQFQDGLFRYDIPTFGEESVREAVLNAICHRDYRDGGSIWLRQYPRLMEIESPGGFPAGITPKNILTRQNPRNRRIAEALVRCGFVERSGQGADRMFRQSIRQAKPLPDYSASDEHRVILRLNGQVGDPRFLRFLEQVGEERLAAFTIEDFLVLDLLHREAAIPESLRGRIDTLLTAGVVERLGRRKYILSRQFYAYLGELGAYTRRKGLDRNTEKELLLKHIRDSGADGAPMRDLMEVLRGRPRPHVGRLLRELRDEDKVHVVGLKRAARWFHGPGR
ncbi:MAG: ATP-binding protein [Rhodospirillales bacterium]